ncbi:MAG: protein tyrosine phosphatase family protein [Planctomycetota bacterium]|jgi:uncharacterized protein (TIGR01244 family)
MRFPSIAVMLLVALSCSAPGDAGPGASETELIVPAGLQGFPSVFAVGDVLIGGQPTPEGLVNARDSGVAVVINARPESEMSFDERSVVQGLGMRYVSLPVTPSTLTDATVAAFIAEMEGRTETVLVHCSSGNRVAALWAMYEIQALDVDPERAVSRARDLGLRSEKLIGYIGDWARRTGAW